MYIASLLCLQVNAGLSISIRRHCSEDMAIALATLDANSLTTETESDFADELTESSENLFLRNLTAIIANTERASSKKRESQLSVAEVPMSQPQPQLGYFLPISLTPRRTRRFKFDQE